MLLSLPGVANGTGNLLAAAKQAALGVSRGEMVPGGPADSYPRDAIRVDHKITQVVLPREPTGFRFGQFGSR